MKAATDKENDAMVPLGAEVAKAESECKSEESSYHELKISNQNEKKNFDKLEVEVQGRFLAFSRCSSRIQINELRALLTPDQNNRRQELQTEFDKINDEAFTRKCDTFREQLHETLEKVANMDSSIEKIKNEVHDSRRTNCYHHHSPQFCPEEMRPMSFSDCVFIFV